MGSGPAGFYAAAALLGADPPAEVDMYERLPTPWGLVRLGVAPDHPKLKEVSRAFERTALMPGFRFFGNVEVGRDLLHAELAELYDAVVYSVGAQTGRRLGIPGEDLPGSWSATELVAWYNGHPDFQEIAFDLQAERAVVVGAGNVALDVARMLALTAEELAPTDTTDRAIEAIVGGAARDRRARTPGAGAGCVHDARAEGDGRARRRGHPRRRCRAGARPRERGVARGPTRTPGATSRCCATSPPGRRGEPRAVRLRFGVSPVAILGESHVEAVEIVRNELVADESGRVRAVPTDERETIPCGVVFRSVGYLGVPLAGLPFDERRGTVPNDGGRVLGADGAPLTGVYVAGWIKRGPTGVIGTNKKDANETVRSCSRRPRRPAPRPRAGSRRPGRAAGRARRRVVDLRRLGGDRRRRAAAGEPRGRPRIKLCTWEELLAAGRSAEPTEPAAAAPSGQRAS